MLKDEQSSFDREVEEKVVQHDWEWLAGWLSCEFDLPLTAKELWKACLFQTQPDYYFATSYRIWFKNRLEGAGFFKFGKNCPEEIWFSCELHCFFLHLEENELHKYRLANQRRDPIGEAKFAVSKIETTNLKEITPIDRVAARVAPPPYRKGDK
jgi:hypothetical protein